jgi:hypothetical protein
MVEVGGVGNYPESSKARPSEAHTQRNREVQAPLSLRGGLEIQKGGSLPGRDKALAEAECSQAAGEMAHAEVQESQIPYTHGPIMVTQTQGPGKGLVFR